MNIGITENFDGSEEPEEKLLENIEDLSDDILIRMAGKGEERAVDELVRRHPELGLGE